jgi:hypothetical protein
MFDAFLSCRILGISRPAGNTHVEIARYWSGQRHLVPQVDNIIYWHDRTRVGVAGKHTWFETPPTSVVPLLHALIPVGWLPTEVEPGALDCFVFVSPLSGIASAFKDAAVEYVQKTAPHDLSTMAVRFSVDLTALMKSRWSSMLPMLKSIEGQGGDDSYKIYRFSGLDEENTPFPSLTTVHSVELQMNGHTLKVDSDFNLRVADVNSERSEIAKATQEAFSFFRPVLTAIPRGTAANIARASV